MHLSDKTMVQRYACWRTAESLLSRKPYLQGSYVDGKYKYENIYNIVLRAGVKTGLIDNNYNFTIVRYFVDDLVVMLDCTPVKGLCILSG